MMDGSNFASYLPRPLAEMVLIELVSLSIDFIYQGKFSFSFSDRGLSLFFFRSWIKRPNVSTASTRFFPVQVKRRKTMLYHLPLDQLPPTTPLTYSLAVASSSLTTLHNNNSSNLALGLIQAHGIPISFLRRPDWKMEVGEESMIIRDNSCIHFRRHPQMCQIYSQSVFEDASGDPFWYHPWSCSYLCDFIWTNGNSVNSQWLGRHSGTFIFRGLYSGIRNCTHNSFIFLVVHPF